MRAGRRQDLPQVFLQELPCQGDVQPSECAEGIHSYAMARVGVVVGDFPRPTETFILRLIDVLGRIDSLDVTVLVCGGYDDAEFRRSAQFHRTLENVRLVSISSANDLPSKAAALARTILSARGTSRRALFTRAPTVVRFGDRGRASRLTDLIGRYGPFDVLHAQYLTHARWLLPAVRVGALRDSRLVIASRGNDTTGPEAEGGLECLRSIMAVQEVVLTPVAQHLADELAERGISADRIIVVPSPIDGDSITYVPPSRRGREALEMLFVGRLVEKKGVDWLLGVFGEVLRQQPTARLTVVGTGPKRSELEGLTRSQGLSEHVLFTGPLQHHKVIELMQRSHVTLVPSRRARDGDSEGVPNVAKEAIVAGSIVIGSDHGGLRGLISDGDTGYSFHASSADRLLEAILRAVASREDWDSVAWRALNRVQADFGYENVSARLLRAYGLEG